MPAEFYLIYLNYLARVKYKKYFRETTRFWLRFDKKGLTVLSLLLHFALMTGVMILLVSYSESYSQSLFLAGLWCGFVWFNVIVDDRSARYVKMWEFENLMDYEKTMNRFMQDKEFMTEFYTKVMAMMVPATYSTSVWNPVA